MIQLFGGCSRSELSVYPKNWDKASAKIKDRTGNYFDWYIHYRFYDPAVRYESGPKKGKVKPKLCPVKGMNNYKTLGERQSATKQLLEIESHRLDVLGYNPFTGELMAPLDGDTNQQVDPNTPFFEALEAAFKQVEVGQHTKEDIKSNLLYIKPAAAQLRFGYLPIKDVRRKHIKALLKRLAIIKPQMDIVTTNKKGEQKVIGKSKWTNNTFNSYRKNLSILFEELIELEATEVNAVHGIKRKKHAAQKKEILTPDECRKVNEFAFQYDIRFWMLINIFYHSGARRTEIFSVQGEHVNLLKKEVKYLVKKGRDYEWVTRPIVDAAYPFWEMAMDGCRKKDYVFSVGLAPGEKPIRPEQITRRWERHIKGKLGISCDWYSLKHLNTTENVEKVFEQLKEAQLQAAEVTRHKSGDMIAKVYDINASKRMNETLKKDSKKFG